MNTPMRRGACPSLATPMLTGDGLLARINPLAGGFSCKALIGLCESALRHGNGIVEVSARGSLQVRGLTPSSAVELERDINGLGITVRTGVPVVTGPLAGIDPREIADPRPLAEALRSAIDHAGLAPRLGPKVSVIVDGRGYFGMDDIIADVRLKAITQNGQTLWHCAIGGNAATARPLGLVSQSEACSTAIAILETLASIGREARAKDIEAPPLSGLQRNISKPAGRIGILPLAPPSHALGIALPFGSMPAGNLTKLTIEAETLGASEIRPAPQRMLLFVGLDHNACQKLRTTATTLGFVTDPGDPRLFIAACPGAPACASARMSTRDLAENFARENADIFDGSFTLHVSGCAKGCAHPGTAALTLVANEDGTGLVVNGKADANPVAHRSATSLTGGLASLAARLRASRQANETSAACLSRLGAAEIATSFGNDQA